MRSFRILLLLLVVLCACTQEFQTYTFEPIREVRPTYRNEMPSMGTVHHRFGTITVDSVVYTSIDTEAFRKGEWTGQPLEQSQCPEPTDEIRKRIVYPEIAKRAELEGSVRCRFLIGKDGKVQKILIEKSDSPIFDRAVQEAIYKTGFTPKYFRKKIPQRVIGTATITFKLEPLLQK